MIKSPPLFFSLFVWMSSVTISLSQTIRNDEQAIRAIFAEIEKGYNEDNADIVLQHYSKEVLVSYPGKEDTDYEGFKKGYAEMMSLKVKKKIALVLDEILISGDLAVVRLQWHTTLYSDKGDILRKAVDLQIFRREDGKWKFYRGMWYHLKPTTSG
jgi:uncharacterized protein (TIGR02246 family)